MSLQPVDLAKVRRGAVLLVNLDPTVGHEIKKTRPCVVISPDSYNKRISTVIVAPITTEEPGRMALSCEVSLPMGIGGLTNNSIAQPHQLRCVDKDRIAKYMGKLPPEHMMRVHRSAQMAIAEISTDR
jgi:mRNA interferase MazF